MTSCPLCGRSVVDDGCSNCGWGYEDWGPLDPASGTDFDPELEDGYIGRNEDGMLE